MNNLILKQGMMVVVVGTLSLSPGFAAGVSKTMRVDHSRPLVVVES